MTRIASAVRGKIMAACPVMCYNIAYRVKKEAAQLPYRLRAALWEQVFAVPCAVTDNHIKLCSGVALKVLLLILRHPGSPGDAASLAKRLNLPAADIADALNYWVESGVLTTADALQEPPVQAACADCAADKPAPPPAPAPPPRPRPVYPREEALSIIEGDRILHGLLQEGQVVFAKPFTSADLGALVGLYSYYGLSAHYILTLLHYCATIGKRSMGYAEKVAASWMENGVDDASVDAHVDALLRRSSNEGRVRTAFGIRDRHLVPKECEMIARWFDTLGFDLDMIVLAYEITVERTGKLAFRYIDKILASWHQQGIKTPQQAKNEPKPSKGQAVGSALERKILEQFMKE
jgi:DnaD/phage-associated family protein